MTTTDFIKLLTEYEFGGATGRPREVMFEVDDEIFETDGIEVTGSGDGLFTELFLSLPSAKRKTGKWIYEVQDRLVDETDDGRVYRKEKRWKCSECGYDKGFALYKPKDKFCVECGAKMEVEE